MFHRVTIRVTTIGIAGLSVLGCELPLDNAGPITRIDDIQQRYVFQVEYESAWFPTLVGIVIDDSGGVTSYAREGSRLEGSNGFTEAELAASYGERASLTQIEAAILVERFNQISGVGNEFREPNVVCADAGFLRYTAFRFDPSAARYDPVLLRAEGDFPRQNTTGEAEALSHWLRDLLIAHPVDGLAPFPEGSCVP